MSVDGGDPFALRGADSARAMLLVTLGEFAYPHDRPVSNTTLVGALSLLGFEAPAIGQAIRRSATTGLLQAQRSGRRVAWRLTDQGRELLRSGGERVFSFTGVARDWDERWLMVTVSVPERDKRVRHQLRRRLEWLGLGTPSAALWISPHTSCADEVRRVLVDLDLERRAISSVGPFGPVGGEQAMVDAAWDLGGLASEYEAFICSYERLEPATPQDAFRGRVTMTQAWRRFPFVDPGLPRRFLPVRWPGERAAALVAHKRELWGAPSREFWEQLDRA